MSIVRFVEGEVNPPMSSLTVSTRYRGAEFVREILDAYAQFNLPQDYPRDNPWVLSAPTLQILGTLVKRIRPANVVEFGSGFSTRIVSALLSQWGGKLVSFDHDSEFAQASRLAVAWYPGTKVVSAPIEWRAYGLKVLPTYRILQEQMLGSAHFDLALIDGPPGYLGREAALIELFPFLSEDCIIVVDDVVRDADYSNIRVWTDVFGSALELLFVDRMLGNGVAILSKRGDVQPRLRASLSEVIRTWRHCLAMKRRKRMWRS
ncbi:MAG: class I SAM-dependent methyltransferase [Acidobacteriota bacterium]|nr:class I SAM-dependent methyltransferase [Acidobacteriota bacterium]